MKLGKIGCSGWSYKQWVGPFYPAGTRPEECLRLYAKVFDVVEIDSTFYGIPSPEAVERWYKSTPENFTFCPKFPQEITHANMGNNLEATIQKFLRSIDPLKKKLGPMLIQFSSSFKYPFGAEKLLKIMNSLPEGYQFALEFRDKSWFNESVISDIRARDLVVAWSDGPFIQDQSLLSSDSIYLRLVGDRSIKENEFGKIKLDRHDKIDKWAERIKESLEEIQDFVVFVNNHFQGFSPATVNAFRSALGMPRVDWDSIFKKSDPDTGRSLFSAWE
ncbi:MAG: DUF72 domain-containing protein [Thermoplasmata archaeon]